MRLHRPRPAADAPAADTVAAPPPALPPAQVNPWKAAARRVEEDRGAPIGKAAKVHIPAELRHYADTRRFLAIQVAGWMEQKYPLPHDEAELAQMIARGDLVEVPSLGEHYILYGVGANATDDPIAHYDRASGVEIPLYPRYDVFEDAAAGSAAEAAAKKAEAAEAAAQAAKLPRAQARRRRTLLAEARNARKAAAAIEKQRTMAAAWYDDYDRRRLLVSEWHALDDLAHHLGKKAYDLEDPRDRRAFRGRLLSFLRPAARDMVLELAARYAEKYGRPLPVTSLVRTQAYQRLLGETNPNATRISIPPHTTGLAFDVYDHYMSGPEQEGLMDMVAALEHDARVEALRERRDHIHIFVFADGHRPPEALIADALGIVRPGPKTATGEGKPAAAPRGAASGR